MTPQVNMRLTGYAQGMAQDLKRTLAELLAPTVPTGGAYGQYLAFDEKNAFQTYETRRAMGGETTTIEFAATDPKFNCEPHGLKIPIDDHERKMAGDNDNILEKSKIKTLISASTLSHEKQVLAAARAAVGPVGGLGVWSNPAIDPVKQINAQIVEISNNTGVMPNTLVFGLSAWHVFIDHPLVQARQPGAALIGLTPNQASLMFINPAIKIEIAVLSMDTKKFGAAKAVENIVGGELWLFYSQPSPTLYDASFMKNFATVDGGVDKVIQLRDDLRHSDLYEVLWSRDIKVVAAPLARRIQLS